MLVEQDLGRPIDEMFAWVDDVPLGSASIAQIHRATTREGDAVVIKVVKPGIPETLRRDARLLRTLAGALQLVFPRYQPRRIIREFVDYTLREVDLRREADNAENFAANFRDEPDIVFPAIYREYSGPERAHDGVLRWPAPRQPGGEAASARGAPPPGRPRRRWRSSG